MKFKKKWFREKNIGIYTDHGELVHQTKDNNKKMFTNIFRKTIRSSLKQQLMQMKSFNIPDERKKTETEKEWVAVFTIDTCW